ncbi:MULTISPECIES: NAD(P)/FAD-dependent oxidoreductase [unclassified Cyanobium]|uniref:NAD(P)/FAD-dependent oxidoreductase n=1 Tax=unclassified Cyanobium TaxID=2627006 RepID=UPI0020CC001C|nr:MULTISPECIES: NAD(P)/FAD-dependent oxidoreductase [unclassified Cyanobium]MCP9857892.1 NAD(P)/FAD-dependent oxidoreductase [Cyanobium sp. Cruz-8H5]MCP9865051.1 NAD(P)/FAD-dependent oxidoreductase [Cyanobium sp. Cruz-8D1]
MLPSRASVVVVGGGPAGFMAAIAAAEAAGGSFPGGVLLLESTPEPLHKVLISGGGRCNVTHACWDPRVLVDHYPRGGKALRGPFSRFATTDTVAWFQAHGLQLVEEADGRLFPRSNRSSSVVDTLRQAALAAGVVLHTTQAGQTAQALPDGGFRLRLRSGAEVVAEHLVLATGSHPSGHRIAASLGHGLVAPVPSLFTLTLADHPLVDLAGVAMDPVQLELLLTPLPGTATNATKPLRQRGPVLITHWGLSGPATLRLTAFAARVLRERRYRAELRVDWTGGRKPADLEGWFAAARRDQARRQLGNWRPWPDLSRRLWLHLLAQGGVEASLRWADLPRRSELALITALRDSRYRISGRGPFGEEFVTAGGIPLAEVNLASMQSRLQPGLFLVGELLDVDGVTGGFNFQHCWSSGWLAGQALAAQRTCS